MTLRPDQHRLAQLRRRQPLVWRLLSAPLDALIRLYQLLLSPLLPPSCRFVPSCSSYARQALATHPTWRALGFIAWRLGRCQPLCAGGHDPVPPGPWASSTGEHGCSSRGVVADHNDTRPVSAAPPGAALLAVLAGSLLTLPGAPALADEAGAAALPGAVSAATAPGSDGGPARRDACRPGTPMVPLRTEAVAWKLSPCRGGVASAALLGDQFTVKDQSAGHEAAPPWAQSKFAPGPLELVHTWDAHWDPFRDRIVTVGDVPPLRWQVRDKPGAAPREVVWDGGLAEAFASDPIFGVAERSDDAVTLVWPDPARAKSPVYLVKRYRRDASLDPHSLAVDIAVWNLGAARVDYELQHRLTTYQDPNATETGYLAMLKGPPDIYGGGFYGGESAVHLPVTDIADTDAEDRSFAGKPDWLMVDSRYFALVTLPGDGFGDRSTVSVSNENMGALVQGGAVVTLRSQGEAIGGVKDGQTCAPRWYTAAWGGHACEDDFAALGLDTDELPIDGPVAAPFIDAARKRAAAEGDSPELNAAIERVRGRRVARHAMSIFAGPKDLDTLRAVAPSLDEAIDFGWFGFLGRPMLWVLRQAHALIGSWALAIAILTLLVKGLLWPITMKSMRSMKKMQALKPEMDKLRERLEKEAKRKGLDQADPQEMQKQTFELYRRHGVNPVSGCLPLFLQMPVYIALYRTIYSAVEMFNQPLFGWVTDLTQKDPYYVLPLLLGVVMFVQQKVMPTSGVDATQQKIMMYMMPVLFTLLMISLPSALTFYILINTLLSIVQSLLVRRATATGATT